MPRSRRSSALRADACCSLDALLSSLLRLLLLLLLLMLPLFCRHPCFLSRLGGCGVSSPDECLLVYHVTLVCVSSPSAVASAVAREIPPPRETPREIRWIDCPFFCHWRLLLSVCVCLGVCLLLRACVLLLLMLATAATAASFEV
jgi:hypothetical protein